MREHVPGPCIITDKFKLAYFMLLSMMNCSNGNIRNDMEVFSICCSKVSHLKVDEKLVSVNGSWTHNKVVK